MDELCIVCCSTESRLLLAPQISEYYCSYCWGPVVIDTQFRPIPAFVLWPDKHAVGSDTEAPSK